MATCFIIQPFDQGAFDKRYEDVFAPAITAANLEPYRVDRDPGVSVPIDEIERGIRVADLCLADITTDNPNVWFELGFALACAKEVVLVCGSDRKSNFPFDVQHRSIITYSRESPRDFDELKEKVTRRIEAIRKKEIRLGQVAAISPVANVEGLSQHEMVSLVAIAQNLETPADVVPVYTIRTDIEKAGFTRIAVTLALAALLKKGLVSSRDLFSERDEASYSVYGITEDGMSWLMANQDKLVLRNRAEDDEIPF
jgi:hypothetical protein